MVCLGDSSTLTAVYYVLALCMTQFSQLVTIETHFFFHCPAEGGFILNFRSKHSHATTTKFFFFCCFLARFFLFVLVAAFLFSFFEGEDGGAFFALRRPNHITSADGRYVLVKSVTKDNMEKS